MPIDIVSALDVILPMMAIRAIVTEIAVIIRTTSRPWTMCKTLGRNTAMEDESPKTIVDEECGSECADLAVGCWRAMIVNCCIV